MKDYKRITGRRNDGTVCVPLNNEFYIKQAYDRLAELEDKLESGKLAEFPCKIGDTVYWNNGVCVTPYRVDGFANYNDGMGLRLLIGDMQPSLLLIGKDLFFDKNKAEQQLAKLKEKQQ